MRSLVRAVATSGLLLAGLSGAFAKPAASPADHNSLVVVFKDGHRQSFSAAEIARIDFKASAVIFRDGHQEKLSTGDIARIDFQPADTTATLPSRAHFFGKWEVGEGNGSHFFITLESDGDARKSIGATHGTWTFVDGEARISWDDGWHDVIRKVGTTHEKVAFAPGKSYSDTPSNVTAARTTEIKPI